MGEADRYVSTGSLPGADEVRAVVAEAYDRYRSLGDGSPSTVYPALASADPSAFGVCVAGVNGSLHEQGDTRVPFTIMSVAKPFTFALACDAVGPAQARDRLGVDATGLAFNSVEAVERRGGRTNPMVNAGAIATVGLVDSDAETAWGTIRRGLSAFAGRDLDLDEVTLESARATNHRNRALAQMLKGYDALDGDAMAVLDVYTRQSCLAVTAADLAVMGATLADGGVHPVSGEQVVSAEACRATLVVMATAGLYETSGEWLYRVGLPGKSGIGGGIVTVSPGKGGLGTYSPPLDEAGNSVRGQLVAELLAERLGLDIFASSA
jgi:glutaminase